jgi:hypothetical protein
LLGFVLAVTGILAVFPGCEEDADTDVGDYFSDNPYASESRDTSGERALTVNPDNGTVSAAGDKVAIAVYGGVGAYTWSVSSTANGSIATQTGSANNENAVYTCLIPANNTVLVSDSEGKTGLVSIRASGSTTLSITPSSQTVATNAHPIVIKFVASGGVTPYVSWSVSRPDLFNVAVSNSNADAYLSSKAAFSNIAQSVTLSVKDNVGIMSTATISIQ